MLIIHLQKIAFIPRRFCNNITSVLLPILHTLERHHVQFEAPTGNVAEWASGYSWCHAAGGHYDKVVKESETMLRCQNQPLVLL
jgi:hypothetical protein